MALHDSLRDLVTVRGPGVVDEAEEFRGVLDDFLAEDEASLGELNLLVDAVRLGALRRVLDVLAHGAAPEAAVREAGAALARDRGTDDPTRSCWALASLCFALGKVDDPMVRMFRSDAGTMPAATPPTGPNGPAPGIAPGYGTAERPETQMLSNDAPVSQPVAPQPVAPQPVVPQPGPTVDVQSYGSPQYAGPSQYSGPVPPVIPEQKASRAGVFLLVVLVALLLGGLVAAGIILLGSDDDGDNNNPTASDGPTTGDTGATDGSSDGSSDGPKKDPPQVSNDEMLVAYEADDNTTTIYKVDAIDGGYEAITGGPLDTLPTLSPDRRTMTYEVGPKPLTTYRWDLESAGYEPFFKDPGPCDHSLRPGWSPDGTRVALACTGDDDLPDGIYVANADGTGLELVVDSPLVRGSPTWTSNSQFVYGTYGSSTGDPIQLKLIDADIGGEPITLPTPTDGGISHADWSPEAEKLLFLVSSAGSDQEIGDVWTMNADGTGQQLLADGNFAHPVWSPDGEAIGVTIFQDAETEVLGYIPLEDGNAEAAVVVADPPPGEVGIPVWGTR